VGITSCSSGRFQGDFNIPNSAMIEPVVKYSSLELFVSPEATLHLVAVFELDSLHELRAGEEYAGSRTW
jgi:hypothetical protein